MEDPPSFVDVTTCCLCSSDDNDQILFRCGHTQCRLCITKLLPTPDAVTAAVCPICHIPSCLPIAAAGSNTDLLPENQSCSVCILKGEVSPCYYECLDCYDLLCTTCSQGHSASSSTVSHRIVPLADTNHDTAGTQLVVSRMTICKKHSGKEITLYCQSCKQLMCMLCALFDHTEHNQCTIKEASGIARETIRSIIEDRTIRLARLELERDKALDAIKTMEISESSITKRLMEKSESIIQQIVAERLAVSQTVNSMFASHKKELAIASEIMQTCIKLTRGTLITCTNALCADNTDMVELCNSLADGLAGIHETEESMFHMCNSHQVPTVQLHIQTPHWPIFTLQSAESNTSDTIGEAFETKPSANNVLSKNHIITDSYSTNSDRVNTDVYENETPIVLATDSNAHSAEERSLLMTDHQRESRENISELKAISPDVKEEINLDDVCDDPVRVVNNVTVPIDKTNDLQQVEHVPSEDASDRENAANDHIRKKIYVPKAFYNPNKATQLNTNIPRRASHSNSQLTTVNVLDEATTSTQITKYISSDVESPVPLQDKVDDESDAWALPQAARKKRITLSTPDLYVPSTYSDAVKKTKRPPMARRKPQVSLSFEYSFDTAVKRDCNKVQINGLCFYENDRILVTDKGNAKLKNLLKDGSQPHNRQFENIIPERIASIRNNIACISKNDLYIMTKDIAVISKVVLCTKPPDKDAVFSFCLTTTKDMFVVGNLPENKLKAFSPTSGNLTSVWDCPVKAPVVDICGTAKGHLLICSWRGRGCIHLVDISGRERQKFLHSKLSSSKDRWRPNDVCSDAREFVFAADYARNEIDVFSPQGEMILTHSTTSYGPQQPHRLIVDPNYRLFVSGDDSDIVVYNISLQ